MNNSFDREHEVWFKRHLRESTGERRRRLEERREQERKYQEAAAETRFLRDVWWPVYGTLEHVHPEYEVTDSMGKTRFLDHAVIQYPVLADFEVDGFNTHQKNATRWSFSDDRRRDASLESMGWRVFRLSYDDIKGEALLCRHLVKEWMDQLAPVDRDTEWRKRVITFGTYQGPITVSDAARILGVSDRTARVFLKKLVEDQILLAEGNGEKRVHAYALNESYIQGKQP